MILTALLLRIAMLGVDVRFHPDEALFAAQARLINTQSDWLLRTTDLDKPPLTFYVTALSFGLLSPSELAARLPNVLFSTLSVAALYVLARALYGEPLTAGLAALLLALSPYDLAFAPTVFTDVQATFWVLIASGLAARNRWTLAGMAAALMFAAKSTAITFLPLILALGLAANAQRDWTRRDLLRRLGRFAGSLLIGIALLWLWDQARAPRSFFDLGYTRNNPGRWIRSDELGSRLQQWRVWFGTITGSDVLNIAFVIALPLWLRHGFKQRHRTSAIDWLMVGFALAFVGWYWLIAFNTYDRYLHMLVPFVLLLAARLLTAGWRALETRPHTELTQIALVGLLVTLLAPGIVTTLHGDSPVGGDRGQHQGIDTVAAFINRELSGAIIYDHWLGWELAYYLGPTPAVNLRYMPQPEACADDMRAQTAPRYLVAPSTTDAVPWLAALAAAGIDSTPIYHDPAHAFVLYRLQSPNDPIEIQ